jgi:predicted ester cyclase
MSDQATLSQYRDVVWRVYDTTFNQKNPAGARDWYAPEYLCHTPLHPDGPIDAKGIEADGDMVLAALPDVTVTFADVFGQDDRLVVRHIFHGTNTGSILGIPPSGREVTISGTDIYRFAGGRIVEEWAQPDIFGLLQQIGALPPPGTT